MFSKATDLSSLSIMEQNLYVAARNCYPWVLENPNRSLIELEIIQAAFLNESQFQYFYFRTGTMLLKPMDEEKEEMVSAGFLINNEEKLKIGKLKAKIISKGLPVRLYRDLHELGVITPARESGPYAFQNPTNHKRAHLHRILVKYFQRQTAFWERIKSRLGT